MEKILENLVNVGREDTPSTSAEENTASTLNSERSQTHMPASSTNSRMDTQLPAEKEVNPSVEEEMDDVMNVLKDLNDVASGTFVTNTNNGTTKASSENIAHQNVVDSLTTVQDVSKVVDFSKTCLNDNSTPSQISAYQAAEEKFAKLSARQEEIEKRFASVNYRVNQMRCRQFGSHVVDELTKLRSYYERIAQPLAQGNQSLTTNSFTMSVGPGLHNTQASKMVSGGGSSGSIGIQLPSASNSQRFGGRTLPLDGISLPSTPMQLNSSQSFPSQSLTSGITIPPLTQIRNPPSLPTTPLDPSDIHSSSAFAPPSIIKTSNTGSNFSTPFHSENKSPSVRSTTASTKKVKVEKAKKPKQGKEKASENSFSTKEQQEQVMIKTELPKEEDTKSMKDGLNHLEANLRHLIHSYDSEATESSSGGESCDEFDGYLDTSYQQNQRDRETKLYQRLKNQQCSAQSNQSKSKSTTHQVQFSPPIKQRAKWAWLANR